MIKIIRERISEAELKEFLGKPYSDMIKFVVDIQDGVIALGGELHADAEALLLEQGCKQSDLWGGNYYPLREREKKIEYESMINIRPSEKNYSTEVKDPQIRAQMLALASRLLP